MASVSCSGVSSRAMIVIKLFFGFVLLCSASPSRHFRGQPSDRTVTTHEVESSLRASLDAVLRGGDEVTAQRLDKIEASMWQTFQALPKNDIGRLAPRAVRYIVHNYFAKEHGWLINGLGPDTMQANVSELHEVSILQDKAPAFVEGLLEARRAGHGLSLGDVVVMVAALERLIFDESIALLEAAYTLNDARVGDRIDAETLHEVLTSYLLVFEMGIKGNLSDTRGHQRIKAKLAAGSATWTTLVEFEQDAVMNFHYRSQAQTNPFVAQHYSFAAASRIVEDLAADYGKWQNTECRQMKEHLMDLAADGSGRVPLNAFYSQQENAEYQFTESVEYLRQIGALDEPPNRSPKVRIANYVAGPSNCIASSTYYSVCCLSDCEGLRNDLESKIQAAEVSPVRLLGVVGNMSSSSVDAPRIIPKALVEKLQAIADRNSGMVPLHGRLFSQWIHYAFPNECPYPHMPERSATLTPGHWIDNKAKASAEEKKLHIESTSSNEPEVESVMTQWTDDEVLPLHDSMRSKRSACGTVLRGVMQVAMLFVVLRIAASMWQATAEGPTKGKGLRKDTGFELPFHL